MCSKCSTIGSRTIRATNCSSARSFCASRTRPCARPRRCSTTSSSIERGFFVEVEHPELGRKFRYPGAPYLFNGTPWRVSRRPPLVGEHTGEILRDELAMAPEAIAVLAAEGVI